MAITDEERREVAAWAAGSAARVQPLLEAVAPADPRPREAIDTARAFAETNRGPCAFSWPRWRPTAPAAKWTIRELAGGGISAADDEIGWAVEHATPAIRDLLRRVPASEPGRRRLDDIERRLDAALRE